MQSRASLASWYALLVLSVATLYAVIDRQVIILLSQQLKADLHLSDTQIGSLQGFGAVLFASIAAFPLGWLADRMDRRVLLSLCVIVWSIGIATCGLATSRSEERRVGKECGRTCRSRGWPCHSKKKKNNK